jgi:hypothetical protein
LVSISTSISASSCTTSARRSSAYGSIRQHTSAYVSICQLHYQRSPLLCIRQHTSAYASIRQHMPAGYVSIRSMRQHTSAYASIRQHTPAYVNIRQHTPAHVKHLLRGDYAPRPPPPPAPLRSASGVSLCTFVLVKQVLLYFCTSKASDSAPRPPPPRAPLRSASGVSICTFVLLSKQVSICTFVLAKLLGGCALLGRRRLAQRLTSAYARGVC